MRPWFAETTPAGPSAVYITWRAGQRVVDTVWAVGLLPKGRRIMPAGEMKSNGVD